jgi:hypothetical protein
MTQQEKEEVRHLLERHERTLEVCRVCANTLRELAWEVKRGGVPTADELKRTIEEAERVLDDLGKMEMAIAQLKAALW